MIIKVFDLLSANGIDTYFIGQHKGECLRKYVVLKDCKSIKYTGSETSIITDNDKKALTFSVMYEVKRKLV